MRDTDTKFGGKFRAVFAKHRVLEFASLEMIRALPREDAARLAHELRACVGNEPPAIQDPPQLVTREWSFLKETPGRPEFLDPLGGRPPQGGGLGALKRLSSAERKD